MRKISLDKGMRDSELTTPPSPDQAGILPGARASRWLHWTVVALLALIAAGLWLRPTQSLLSIANAQNSQLAGARGVYAFTGPIDQNRYGLFMIDIEQGTIWCYEIQNSEGTHKLALTAARSWLYDRYLQDFNTSGLSFRDVQALVNKERSTRQPGNGPNSTVGAGGAADPDSSSARSSTGSSP